MWPSPSVWAGSCWPRSCAATPSRRRVASRSGGAPTAGAAEPVPDRTLDGRPVVLGGGRGPGLQAPDPRLERVAPEDPRRSGLPPLVRASDSGRIPTSGSWATPGSAPSGWARPSACSGTGCTRSPSASWSVTRPVPRWPTGFVFLAATLPNLVLGPIAGTFVDRWDHKRVMIASDLIRAGLVLLIPLVVQVNVLLVYPVVFLVTTVSLFFRPARVAVVPRIVAPGGPAGRQQRPVDGRERRGHRGLPARGAVRGVPGRSRSRSPSGWTPRPTS